MHNSERYVDPKTGKPNDISQEVLEDYKDYKYQMLTCNSKQQIDNTSRYWINYCLTCYTLENEREANNKN